jgi:argininosuccinate synthase
MTKRIVVVCHGSEDLFVAVPTLARQHDAEIVTLALDVGQGAELEQIHERALRAGAVRAHVLDVREEFARDFILPVLQNGALRSAQEPITFALAHALMAKKLVDIALIEDAHGIAHGSNHYDRTRIENCVRALNPNLQIVAGEAPGDRVTAHANLWGRAVEYVEFDAAPELPYVLTKSADAAPESGAEVEIDFQEGVPTAVNGVPLDLTELIESLSIIAGQHGIGRIPAIPHPTRHNVFRIYEAPAATVLHTAHDALEFATESADLMQLKWQLREKYVELVVRGLWFSDLREALDAFGSVVQRHVTGTVHLHLRKGECTVSELGVQGGLLAHVQDGHPADMRMAIGRTAVAVHRS